MEWGEENEKDDGEEKEKSKDAPKSLRDTLDEAPGVEIWHAKDIDIVLHLEETNIRSAFEALGAIGYTPIVPVTAVQFANTELR